MNAPEGPCPCGDYYCADAMPPNQDRSRCCQYCGYYNCDVCGWTSRAIAALLHEDYHIPNGDTDEHHHPDPHR
jgi:hypothetical protein